MIKNIFTVFILILYRWHAGGSREFFCEDCDISICCWSVKNQNVFHPWWRVFRFGMWPEPSFLFIPLNININVLKCMLVPYLHFYIIFLQATATYPDGNRVPNLKFTATVTIDGSSEQILQNDGWGNEMGDVAMSFQVPPQAKSLAITVRFMCLQYWPIVIKDRSCQLF